MSARDDGHAEYRTNVSLKEYLEAKLIAMQRATEVATTALDKRLEGMNEFRDALKDQTSRMLTRQEHDLQCANIQKDVRELRDFRAELRGKASAWTAIVAIVLSVAGLAIAILQAIR